MDNMAVGQNRVPKTAKRKTSTHLPVVPLGVFFLPSSNCCFFPRKRQGAVGVVGVVPDFSSRFPMMAGTAPPVRTRNLGTVGVDGYMGIAQGTRLVGFDPLPNV